LVIYSKGLSLIIAFGFKDTPCQKKLIDHVTSWNAVNTRGQITSKGLFGILGFFQKTNEQIFENSEKLPKWHFFTHA
jgi:hypothetical protein